MLTDTGSILEAALDRGGAAGAFNVIQLEHAEGLVMQDEAVRLFERLAAQAPELKSMLDYAYRHREVIERFGRFPHRNAALGRRSTAEEQDYIATPGTGF